jgi:hypothetical protein
MSAVHRHQAMSRYQSEKNVNGRQNFMIDWSGADKSNNNNRGAYKMKRTRSKLRSFRDVTDLRKRFPKHLRLEANNQPDEVSDVQYCVTGLPKDMAQNDKLARVSELAVRSQISTAPMSLLSQCGLADNVS